MQVAVAYRRVSTDDQHRSGLGLDDQDATIRAFCEARGLTLDATFTEVESGKRDDRPELAKALARARRVRGLLVVSTLSRLGRRVSFVASLMDAGTPFACADAPDDEPFILHVKASFAEEECRKISQRTRAALAQAKARGVTLGTNNLTREGARRGAARAASTNRTKAQVEYADIRPVIVSDAAQGLSLRAIAQRLTAAGQTTRNGRPWNAMQVRRVLAMEATA